MQYIMVITHCRTINQKPRKGTTKPANILTTVLNSKYQQSNNLINEKEKRFENNQ